MGWFTKKKEEEKAIIDDVRKTFSCPHCKEGYFIPMPNYYYKATMWKNIEYLVGKNAGVCSGKCGAICHGKSYATGYDVDTLTKIAGTNNCIVVEWMDHQHKLHAQGTTFGEEEFERFIEKYREMAPDLFPKLNVHEFCRRCVTYLNASVEKR